MKIAIDAREAFTKNKAGKGVYTYEIIKALSEIDHKNEYFLYTKNKCHSEFISACLSADRNLITNEILNQVQDDASVCSQRQPEANRPFDEARTIHFELPSNFKLINIRWPSLLWFSKVKSEMKKQEIDIVFSPTSYVFSNLMPKKTISVIYDLAVFKPDTKPFLKAKIAESLYLKKIANKNPKLIAISKSTKYDILKKFPQIDPKKIEIAYPAVSDFFESKPYSEIHIIKKKNNINKPYILSLGTIEPRKNYIRLIEAYSKLDSNLIDKYDLIIAGKPGWGADEVYKKAGEVNRHYCHSALACPDECEAFRGDAESIQKDKSILDSCLRRNDIQDKNDKRKGNIKFLNYVDFKDLPALYSGATLFAYPSLWEGFGMPVLEAIKCKTAVLTSNTSSLPEAAGKYAYYVDPMNTLDIKNKMEYALKNEHDRDLKISASQGHLKDFSWTKSAETILKSIESLNITN